jgi:hypothetical protein
LLISCLGSAQLDRISRFQLQRRFKVDNKQLTYKVDGDIKLHNNSSWSGSEIDLVFTDARLTPSGKKRHDIVVCLTPGQWSSLAALARDRERRLWLMDVAEAEMRDWWKRQMEDSPWVNPRRSEWWKREDTTKAELREWAEWWKRVQEEESDYKRELIRKFGMGDWLEEDLPYSLQKRPPT